jgi:hypothetical protein
MARVVNTRTALKHCGFSIYCLSNIQGPLIYTYDVLILHMAVTINSDYCLKEFLQTGLCNSNSGCVFVVKSAFLES